VHAGLDAALTNAGMRQRWVVGTVSSLRRKNGFVSLELVEYQRDATTVRSALPVGVFRQAAAEIDRSLAGAGVRLEDGIEIALYGRLEPNGAYGQLRMVGLGCRPPVAVDAVVLAETRWFGSWRRVARRRRRRGWCCRRCRGGSAWCRRSRARAGPT
jgi:hypothetical protein